MLKRTYNFALVVPVQRPWPIFVFLMFLGVCFLGLSALLVHSRQDFLSRAIETSGEVIRLERRNGYYYPIVSYADRGGAARELYTDQGSSSPVYFQGEHVVVLYDPTDPEFPVHAQIKKFRELWVAPIAFGFMGLIFLGLPAVIWIASTRHRRGQTPAVHRAER